MIGNPFITYGYESADYFCDRVAETQQLTMLLRNGNHVALISPRRMGKTGLLYHCFAQQEIQKEFYTLLIDIYATKNLQDGLSDGKVYCYPAKDSRSSCHR